MFKIWGARENILFFNLNYYKLLESWVFNNTAGAPVSSLSIRGTYWEISTYEKLNINKDNKAQSVLRVINWMKFYFLKNHSTFCFFCPNRLLGAYFGSNYMAAKLASIYVQGCSLQHSRGKKIPPNRMKVCYWKMVDGVITCMVWNAMQKMKTRFHLYTLSWKDFHGVLLSVK